MVSFFVHHEPTFERDEVRRHQSVVVLTPTRLILAHTDEHTGDDLLPEPYTSTSTEAVRLSAVKSVVVTRMTANPTSGPKPPAEAVMTIGWGGVSRVDLEPAGCSDPECEADHGYTGVLASDDFSLRVSAAADGDDAVGAAAGLRRVALGADPRATRERRSRSLPTASGRSVTWCRRWRRARRARRRRALAGWCCPTRRRTSCSWSTASVTGCSSATPTPRRTSPRCRPARQPGTAGVPSTTATSLTSLGTGLTPGAHGLVGFTARVPGTDQLLNQLFWDQDVDPLEWQPHPTAFSGLEGGRGRRSPWSTSAPSTAAA